jgi:hypothetical protein
VTCCTVRRPEPNAFQRLIAAVVANDERRIKDEAVRVVRRVIATKPKRRTPAKVVKHTAV